MRSLWISAMVIIVAAPLPALAQASESIMEGQATAVQLTRAQAMRDIEHAGYHNVSKLTLGEAGIWTATTERGSVKVNPGGQVTPTS